MSADGPPPGARPPGGERREAPPGGERASEARDRAVPSLGADCHVHLLAPARFRFADEAPYRPLPGECGDCDALLAVLDAHGLSHALLVNPLAGYTFDNRCMLDALARGPRRFRGVAIVRPDAGDAELDALRAAGVVGVRLDTIQMGTRFVEDADRCGLLRRCVARGLVVQLQCEGDQLARVERLVADSGATLVVDHCGRPDPALGLDQPGFRALLRLARTGRAFVKLSGAARFSREAWPHADVDPYVAALLGAFGPTHCVWASDWPFLRAAQRIDYGPTLALLARWLPAERDRQVVLRETPARLFGLGAAAAPASAHGR